MTPGVSPGRAAVRPEGPSGILTVVWLVVVAGLGALFHYAGSPGPAGRAPASWPADNEIKREAGQPLLVMFAHPRCPCTRASLAELARLMADTGGRARAEVWFLRPAGADAGWTNAALWDRAAGIPGVTAHWDAEGREAARFGAATSGETLLYDGAGRLRFAGGITGARGHEGDNAGRTWLTACLRGTGGPSDLAATKIFGCPLFADQYPPDARRNGKN